VASMEPEKREASESLQASGSHEALSRWGPTDALLTSANDGTMCPAAPLWRQARHGTRIQCQEAKCERH